jgi:hypothetical protein
MAENTAPPLEDSKPNFAVGSPEVLRQLTYYPMAWETHGVDNAIGPNGWGPFPGPWTPEDFISPFWGIDDTWQHGDNAIWFAPGYANLTVYEDPSLDFVANSSFLAELERSVGNVSQSFVNTMAAGSSQDSSPSSPQSSLRVRMMKALGVGGQYAG